MNPETADKPVWHFGINFILASLLFIALGVMVKLSVSVPPINTDRAALRSKALADIRAAEATGLNTPGWVDRDRGLVRLPIETAMRIYEQAAQNPEAARADLIARADKAAAPQPKQPPKPNPFE
jgi:hypothetical protein